MFELATAMARKKEFIKDDARASREHTGMHAENPRSMVHLLCKEPERLEEWMMITRRVWSKAVVS